MPSLAVAPVPSMTKLHGELVDALICIWLMVPVTTPPLNDEKLTCQGRPVARSVQSRLTRRARSRLRGLLHEWKPTAEIDPACEPASPLPLLSVPLKLSDVHVNIWRFLVSSKVAVPDLAVMAPPGRIVHVVAARAVLTPRAVAATAAHAANRMRA